MKAENVPDTVPADRPYCQFKPYVEKKHTVHPAWLHSPQSAARSIQYGAESCPRTLDILSRFAGVSLHPKLSSSDVDDVVAAIRKVYPQIVPLVR